MSSRTRIVSMLPLLTAYAAGKEVEYKHPNQTKWTNIADLMDIKQFVDYPERYRVKPDSVIEVTYSYNTNNKMGVLTNKLIRTYANNVDAEKDIKDMVSAWEVVEKKEVELPA